MIYSVSMGAVYFDDGRRVEKQLNVLFDAPDDLEAACDAMLWVNARFEALHDMFGLQYVGSIKVGRYVIRHIDPQGVCGTRYGGDVFEWKYDTGFRTGLRTDCSDLVGSHQFNALLNKCAALRGN